MKYCWAAILCCVVIAGCGDGKQTGTVKTGAEKSAVAKSDAGAESGVVSGTYTGADREKDESPKVVENAAPDENAKSINNPAAELAAAHLKAALAWQMDYRNAAKEDKSTVLKQRPSYAEYCAKFKALADQHPETPIAASAHAWMALDAPDPKDKAASLQALVDSHPDTLELCRVVTRISSYFTPGQQLDNQLERLLERSSNPAVKAATIYSLLKLDEKAEDLAKRYAANPAKSSRKTESEIEYLKNFVVDESKRKAYYGLLLNDYSDVDVEVRARSMNFGDFAEQGMFKIEHLSVGRVAPDIVGKDLDGVEFKLSDYRGKVVMLDFWGDW